MVNLKEALMVLGNRLVTERRYAPGNLKHTVCDPSTKPIVDFTEFLNDNEAAREILAELGFLWPVVKRD